MPASQVRNALQLSIRAALSAGLAVAIAPRLNLDPLLALIAAVIVTDLSPPQTRQLGLQRLAGSVLGAVVGAVLSQILPASPWTVGLGVLTAMFLGQLIRRKGAARLAGYTCGIVVLAHGHDPWTYALYRLVETALGILLAVIVSGVPKLMHIEPTDEAA